MSALSLWILLLPLMAPPRSPSSVLCWPQIAQPWGPPALNPRASYPPSLAHWFSASDLGALAAILGEGLPQTHSSQTCLPEPLAHLPLGCPDLHTAGRKAPSLPFALKFSPGGSGAAPSFPVVGTKTLQSFQRPLPPTSNLAQQGILSSLP